MTKEVYVSKKSRGDAPGRQDLASPVGHGFCSEVSVPRAGWGSCSRLARPQGLQLGWLLWSRCSAPSLPRQLTLSPESCSPKRARLPKGPTCVPNPADTSCLSEFPSPTPIPGCRASRPGWGLSTCDKHLVAGPAHGRGLGRKHPPSLRSWQSVFRSRALAGSPGELSLLCAHISLVRLHNRDKVGLFNRKGGAVTDCSTRPTQGHGAQNPPFLAGSALGPEGIFPGLSPACWFGGGQPPEEAAHAAQSLTQSPGHGQGPQVCVGPRGTVLYSDSDGTELSPIAGTRRTHSHVLGHQ